MWWLLFEEIISNSNSNTISNSNIKYSIEWCRCIIKISRNQWTAKRRLIPKNTVSNICHYPLRGRWPIPSFCCLFICGTTRPLRFTKMKMWSFIALKLCFTFYPAPNLSSRGSSLCLRSFYAMRSSTYKSSCSIFPVINQFLISCVLASDLNYCDQPYPNCLAWFVVFFQDW